MQEIIKRRGRGRPMDPAVSRRILEATRARMATDGYQRMTIADVAADARVTRPTVYKRWSNKADLAAAALQHSEIDERVNGLELDALAPREAVRAVLRVIAEVLGGVGGVRLLASVLIENQHHPCLLDLVYAQLVDGGRTRLAATIAHAQRVGQLRNDLEPLAVGDLLFGAVLVDCLRSDHADNSENTADRVLDSVWGALARQRPLGKVGRKAMGAQLDPSRIG